MKHPKPSPGDPAVLFVNIGWSESYDGSEPVVGNHRFLAESPDDNGELFAFEEHDGLVRCGAGAGKLGVPRVDVVFVARPPEGGHRIVGVYFDARVEVDSGSRPWATVRTGDYLLLPVRERPKIEWPGRMGMRRWAHRAGASGSSHPHLYRGYRQVLARHDRTPGGYGWDRSVTTGGALEEDADEPERDDGEGTETPVLRDRAETSVRSNAHVVCADSEAATLLAHRPGARLLEVLRHLFAREDLQRLSIASFVSEPRFVELTGLERRLGEVELRWLVPTPEGATPELARWLRDRHRSGLLEAYEYPDLGPRRMHVKAVLAELADGRRVAVLGSANATGAALTSNEEFSVALTSPVSDASCPFAWFSRQWERALELGCVVRPEHFEVEELVVRRRPLFEYQRDAQSRLTRFLLPLLEPRAESWGEVAHRGGGLVVLPTGAGKTLTALRWIFDEVLTRPELGRVLWLSHRRELLEQAHDTARHELFFAPSRPDVVLLDESGGANPLETGDLLFVSSQRAYAIAGRLTKRAKLPPFGLIVVDEAHRASTSTAQYGELLRRIPHRARLGLTATPFRGTTNDQSGFAELFQLPADRGRGAPTAFAQYTVEELEARPLPGGARLFSRLELHRVDTGFRFRLRSSNEVEFVRDEIRYFKSEARDELVARTYLEQFSGRGPAVLFAIDVDHANRLAARINAQGGRAQAFHEGVVPPASRTFPLRGATMSRAERGLVLRRFESGHVDLLCCVQLLTEGFDLPALSTILLARPTFSTLLMTQMIGRGLRGPAVGGSETCHLVDFADQVEHHRTRAREARLVRPADAERWRRGDLPDDSYLV